MSGDYGAGDKELPVLARRLIEGAVGGGTAFAALVGPVEGVVVASAAPLVVEGLSRAGVVVRQRWFRNDETMLAEAQQAAEMEMDELLARLVSTPARQELLATTMEAAAHAQQEEKIKVLGQALAAGAVGDDDVVDRELALARVIADLERPQVQLLDQLDHALSGPFPFSPSPAEQEVLNQVRQPGRVRPPESWPLDHSMATLERHGLVRGEHAIPTDFGREVLRRLREAGEGRS